jgi:hypothetical protein
MAVVILFLIGSASIAMAVSLRKRKKTLAFVSAVTAIGAIAILAVVLRMPSARASSPECERIRNDVTASLHVGDSEKVIVPFFEARRWQHASAPIIGLYSAEVFVRRTFVGAEESVVITIDVKNGAIARIHVSDLTRFL